MDLTALIVFAGALAVAAGSPGPSIAALCAQDDRREAARFKNASYFKASSVVVSVNDEHLQIILRMLTCRIR